MSGTQRLRRRGSRSNQHLRGGRSSDSRARRPGYESLEDRRLLTGYFDEIRDLVAGDTGAMATITGALRAVDSLTRLPLINKPIKEIGELTGVMETFRGDLYTALDSLGPTSTEMQIKDTILTHLGPSGVNVLANQVGPSTVGPEDVAVDFTHGVDISIDIGFTTDTFDSEIGLGIDAVPFRPQDHTNGGFSVELTYHNFNFGYDTTTIPPRAYFSTDAPNELELTLRGFLPSSFTAGLGFLNFKVTDLTPGTDPDDADLTLTLTSDVDSSFGTSIPQVGGSLNLLANLEVQVPGDGMPKLSTDLRLNWGLPNVSANVPLGADWGAPTLRFENVSVDLGSLLGSIAKPIANQVKEIIEPLEPLFDLLQKRIPAVSDLSEAVGGPTINLVTLSEALSLLPQPPTQFIEMVESADRLRTFSETINRLASLAGGGWINVGSFDIVDPSGNLLTGTPPSALGSIAFDAAGRILPWSSLITPSGGINFEEFKQQIRNLLGNDLGDEVNGLWDALGGNPEEDGLTFKFPIAEDPSGVALGMLLGRDADLVTIAAGLHQPLDRSFDIKIIPGFFIHVTATANFEAVAKLGYDTRGLREAIAPLYVGNSFDFSKTLNGFWIDSTTHVTAGGTIGLGPRIGFPDVATFDVTGGLTGSLYATISNPGGVDKIRPFAGDLGDRLFSVGGRLDATAEARLKVGVDVPVVGFVGFDKTWPLASATLFEFTTDRIPLPASLIPPPPQEVHLFSYDAAAKTLTLNVGERADERGVFLGEINESLIVKRFSRVASEISGGAHGELDLFQRLVFTNEFEISAFGYTQRFSGQVDNLIADFGSGDDSLKIEDPSSPTRYEIRGGDGDDVIDIDGRVDALIYGERGSDTIDGGSGQFVVSIDGGHDTDEITFGDGRLDRVNPDAIFIVFKEPNGDDFSTDKLTIDNSRSSRDTKYTFQTVTLEDIALIVESSDGNQLVSRAFLLEGVRLDLFSGSGNDQFLGTAPVFARLYGGGGDDLVDLNYGSPGQLPVNTGLIGYATFFGGEGRDTVLADDTATSQARTYTLDVLPLDGVSSALIWGQSATSFYGLSIGGVEDTQFKVPATRSIQVKAWADGDLRLEAGEVQVAADSYMLWDSNLIIRNTPRVKLFDAHPTTDFSTAGVDASGPYVLLPQPDPLRIARPRVRLDVDAVASNFSYQVDEAIFDLSPELLAKPWNISFASSSAASVNINSPLFGLPNVTAPDYHFRLDTDRIEIGSMTLPLAGIGHLFVNSGQGNDRFQVDGNPDGTIASFRGGFGDDNFVVGDGLVGFIPAWDIDGGPDTDVLTIDNHLSTFNTTWEVRPNLVVFFGGVFSVGTGGVETISLLGGSGDDEVRFSGHNVQGINLDTGDGNDTIILGSQGQAASFAAPLNINAAAGNDSFSWNGANNGFNDGLSLSTYPVLLDGGSGYNALAIDEANRGPFAHYGIFPDRFRVDSFGSTAWADFQYDNLSGIVLACSDDGDRIDIFGTSVDLDIGNQFTILGKGGDDEFYVHPRDAVGNLTLNGNLGIGGGAGADRVLIDDGASALPVSYGLDNHFGAGTTSVGGLGAAGFGVGSDVERLDVRAGSDNDTFRIDNYLSSTTALSITAGAGNDVLEISPGGRDLVAALNNAATYSFDGGEGSDSFRLFNDNGLSNWIYTRNANNLNLFRVSAPYTLNLSPQSFESWTLTGGTQPDTFYLSNLPSGEAVAFEGGGDLDALVLGFLTSTGKDIRGQVVFDGGAGGGTITVHNAADAAGSTFHIDDGVEGTLGSRPGDNLFGPGGSLRFRNLANGPDGFGMTLSLGSGADTIYATPLTTGAVSINAGDPSNSPGDRLNLGLFGVQNSVVVNTGSGSGRVTSSNRQLVQWTGIEQVASDTTAVAKTFLVVNTLDSGSGSLRQAILDANATANVGGPDRIEFAIFGAGSHTIEPLTALPIITDPVVLDATTQPGFAGTPIIELDGGRITENAVGLAVYGGHSTVRGLAVNRFSTGLLLGVLGNNVVEGNYVGVGVDGVTAKGNAAYGIAMGFGSGANRIGTDGNGASDAAERNIIAGSVTANILVQGVSDNVVAGNHIGANAAGSAAIGNAFFGIWLSSAANRNRIGTNSDGVSDVVERNVISGNQIGIYLDGSGANSAVTNTVIAGNWIGPNAAGTSGVGNTSTGILVQASDNNTIGGAVAAAANVIAFNQGHGVQVLSGAGNVISRNSIFENGALGIDLAAVGGPANGVTLNDLGDADDGPNGLQNFPQITSAVSTSTQTVVRGTLQSTPGAGFRIEFFAGAGADPSGYGEGQTYLGFVSAGADDFGNVSFVASFFTSVPAGHFVTATATDPLGNTSEFSASAQVAVGPANVVVLPHPSTGGTVTVTSPPGSSIAASITTDSGVAPPHGIEFPFGFLDFTVRGIASGSAANVTIAGLDLSQIGNYYKYGATPANRSDHWYSFLFGRQTDNDSAVDTGMEIVGGNIVLHLVDGGRGDDDLTANGVIADIGGPARNRAPIAQDLTATVTEDGKVGLTLSATDAETPAAALRFTVTSLPLHGQLSTSSGAIVQIGDRFTGPAALVYEPGAAREGVGSDGFTYTVTDAGGAAGALSDDAVAVINIIKAVADRSVSVDAQGVVRIGGTSGKDDIVAQRSGAKLQVKINGVAVGGNILLSSVHEIRAWGRGGNDKISVLVDVPAMLHGGPGDDTLAGGPGSSLLFGGVGDDKITSGDCSDLLVGGAGKDNLVDAAGDDILVGGLVSEQLTDDFFRQVLAQWDNSRTRNGRFISSLIDDRVIDKLFDGSGDDWFILGVGDRRTDACRSDHDTVTVLGGAGTVSAAAAPSTASVAASVAANAVDSHRATAVDEEFAAWGIDRWRRLTMSPEMLPTFLRVV